MIIIRIEKRFADSSIGKSLFLYSALLKIGKGIDAG